MSILFMTSADLQDIKQFTNITGVVVTTNTYARTGSYSFDIYSTNGSAGSKITSSTTGYIRFAIKLGGIASVDLNSSDETNHLSLKITTSGIDLIRGGWTNTPIDSSVIDLSDGEFHVYEWYWNISDSGSSIIKVDGVEEINFSGDTRNGGTTTDISLFAIHCRTIVAHVYVDDIIVRDDAWPGLGGIYVLKPNAGSTNENWSASTGNPEDCVDDLPVSFTDYISTDGHTVDTEHLFGFESLPITPGEINGVGVVGFLITDYSSEVNVRTLLKSGTTTEVGNTVAIGPSETFINTFYHQNPDTSLAWQNSELNSLEAGVEIQ